MPKDKQTSSRLFSVPPGKGKGGTLPFGAASAEREVHPGGNPKGETPGWLGAGGKSPRDRGVGELALSVAKGSSTQGEGQGKGSTPALRPQAATQV